MTPNASGGKQNSRLLFIVAAAAATSAVAASFDGSGGVGDEILLKPQLLNYVVAVYLILVGAIGLNNMYHLIR
jgi:Protein of unknown function (DUF3096)